MQHQLGGFCLLLFLLGLLAVVDHMQDRLNTHYWQSTRLQTELQHTLQHARREMRTAATKLASDRSFIKNVTWQLTHSAQQSITSAIAGEAHWQVAVFGKQCDVLHGTPNATTQALCRSLHRGQTHAITRHDPPQLGYLHAFTTTKGAVLITLPLQEQWLAQQQALAKLRAALPPTQIAISSTANSHAAVRFVYQQDYLNHLLEHAQSYRGLLFWTCILLYAALVVLCVMLYFLARRQAHAMQCDLQQLAAWSEQPTEGGLLQVKVKHALVQRILHNCGRALQAQLHYLASVKKQIAVKNKLLARLSKENHYVRDTLAQQTLASSTLDQAAHFNAHFIANNIAIRDNAQDLRATIFAVHRQQLKPLLQLSSRWRQEFNQRHVADFLGAYYNAEQENFLLRLEKDLRHIAALAEETYTTLTNTLNFTRQLSSRTRNILIPLQFWEQALAKHTSTMEINFTNMIRQAQELTTKINTTKQVKFNNHFTADYQLIAVPAMLVAAFYHLYQFVLPETQACVEVSCHTALKNKQLYVTLSTTNNTDDKHSTVKKFHLAQARLILQKYHIEVQLSWLNNSLVLSTNDNTNVASLPTPNPHDDRHTTLKTAQ